SFRIRRVRRTRCDSRAWRRCRSGHNGHIGRSAARFDEDRVTAASRFRKGGDLFLRVRLAKHPDFSVEGSDLIHEVRIQPWQAVLGGELLVPTPEGKVRLKIPPGTQGGQRFRLRERGLPGVSGRRGDLYVVGQINIPKKLTEREREVWSELAKLHGA